MPEQNKEQPLDPVLSLFDMPLSGVYFPLGFPLQISTNSEDVLRAAEESWGRFRRAFDEKSLRLRIGVLDNGVIADVCVPVVRSQRHLMAMVGGLDHFAICDMKEGFGFCWLSEQTARNRAHLRYYYLEPMVYVLLEGLHLTQIHAACVSLNGHGALLCGDSGAGKSSLAYACARRGWTYICDDASNLLRGIDGNVVIGNPHRIRLRESATELFPELSDHPVTLRAQGERAIELETAHRKDIATAPHATIERVVFLRRESGATPIFLPFSRERAMRWFESVLCFGEEAVHEAQLCSLRRLLSLEILEFHYDDPDSAVAGLKSLMEADGSRGPASELPVERQINV